MDQSQANSTNHRDGLASPSSMPMPSRTFSKPANKHGLHAFSISRSGNDIVWNPPHSSVALVNALHWHYHTTCIHEEQVRQALDDFFEWESSTGICIDIQGFGITDASLSSAPPVAAPVGITMPLGHQYGPALQSHMSFGPQQNSGTQFSPYPAVLPQQFLSSQSIPHHFQSDHSPQPVVPPSDGSMPPSRGRSRRPRGTACQECKTKKKKCCHSTTPSRAPPMPRNSFDNQQLSPTMDYNDQQMHTSNHFGGLPFMYGQGAASAGIHTQAEWSYVDGHATRTGTDDPPMLPRAFGCPDGPMVPRTTKKKRLDWSKFFGLKAR
ncbi:hypothetical protein NLG97_g5341 [Lecanicillium saksenae]|uniref:Uncharacterized protein n=1 Tax=Lecanicillium saksenae TaxID=468837 RepID=A0ACC1QV45_9HYPO|nr:hypothetical protein NLG97_g5341 [Lecanicillium saksenae]